MYRGYSSAGKVVLTEPTADRPSKLRKSNNNTNKNGKPLLDIKGLSEKMSGLYQESTLLFEQLVSERTRLKGEMEYREYTKKLLDSIQLMMSRLHEVEIALLENEAEFHQALIRIQGDIKVKKTEADHEKEKYEENIAAKDKIVKELLEEKRIANVREFTFT